MLRSPLCEVGLSEIQLCELAIDFQLRNNVGRDIPASPERRGILGKDHNVEVQLLEKFTP